ncbi:MAG: L-lysine 6-aminotransferase [Lysobacteraceae bacterium]|nr:MAG: L-lysine 6-aminotransferase [Xanthomonadaceae bacterium]
MAIVDRLQALRDFGGERITRGLPDEVLEQFADDAALNAAIDEAVECHQQLQAEFGELMTRDESEQIQRIQRGFVNFYPDDAINPYIAIAARGPWVITSMGAVLHDSGGYGMLGFGHGPSQVIDAMGQNQVMANIMTPNFSQLKLDNALRSEIGRDTACPYDRFLCLNSGSEAVTVGARITDINAKLQTDPGGRHAGKPIRILGLKGAFHGRTDRPARFSDSTRKTYKGHLASFRDMDNLLTVPVNDVEALKAVFSEANQHGWFIEAMFMEPVMGEGNPGMGITREFYDAARELTRQHGSLLLIDSIQAGLRVHGCLSIVDYPGFEGIDPPDMETYSKALNAGQYPLSVLAMSPSTSSLYRKGVYGNTMTTNPRAMDVACTVLDSLDDALRANIVARGQEFIDKFEQLKSELNGEITHVQGTGLLLSVELDPAFKSYGSGSIEEYLRMRGIGVIHGGENSLRYTPHFGITSEEVDLIISATRHALLKGPRLSQVA